MRKATRITYDPSPEARKVLEKLTVAWHLNLREVLEALVRREGGIPPFEKREPEPEDELAGSRDPRPSAPPAPPPILRDPTAITAPGWVRALAAAGKAGRPLAMTDQYALRAWMVGEDMPAPFTAPLAYPELEEQVVVATPEPARLPPEPEIGPPVRAWDDPDAPQWVRAIGQTLELGDIVPDEGVLLFRRWRAGEDVEP